MADPTNWRDRAECRGKDPAIFFPEVRGVVDTAHSAAAEILHLRNQRDPLRLIALCVALAAMVPDDRPARELLAWTDDLTPARVRSVA